MLPQSPFQRRLAPLVLALLATTIGLPAIADEWSGHAMEHFEKRIRPLLVEKCIECHGPEKQKGGLRLDIREGWETGGDNGPALVPGDLDRSRIIQAVRYDDPDFQMPPKTKLSKDAIADLEEWVALGAPDPRSGELARKRPSGMSVEEGRSFWSFRPIANPDPPVVDNTDETLTEIDRFIQAKQHERGLTQNPPAAPADLARRAYFTLIGLPPTPEQVDAFAADRRPDAFERLVDELLQSPHFGERWGRHWLDVARFAESSGGGRTLLFKDAWRYRDYVIEQFNADTPFDQFVREQIAGDLLDTDSPSQRSQQLVATAFLALGPTNYEQQDKQLLRYDVIDEQIDTLGKAFLGMTLSCARCHDHKFDPVPTADYYALAGIFKSTRTLFNYTDNVARWVDTPLPLEGDAAETVAAAEAQRNQLKPRLDRLEAERRVRTQDIVSPPKPGLPKLDRHFPGLVLDDMKAEAYGEWKFSQFSQNYLNEGYLHDGNERKGYKSLTFETQIPLSGQYEVRIAYSELANRSTRTPVTVGHAGGELKILVDQQKPPSQYGRFHSLGQFRFEAGSTPFVQVTNENTDGYVVVDGIQWLLVEEDPSSAPSNPDERLKQLSAAIKKQEKALAPVNKILKARPLAMTVKEDPKPSDSAIRIRGVESRKGDIVPRGFLQVATFDGVPEIPDHASGRVELADWIVHPDNPLTTRVLANRIWTWLFGSGIVSSVDNLGTTGDAPSHPELLDYLAQRIQKNNWSLKTLIREIMLTRAWQASAAPNPEAQAIDADNRLLASFPKRRLDAEQLRDAILAASGALDTTYLGPNIVGAGEINANSTAAQNVEYNYIFEDTRRSVYTPAFRVNRHELFELFDFANANFTFGRRATSTVALQALYLLNNPFVIEQSEIAAKALLAHDLDTNGQIEHAFKTTLGRSPTPNERQLVGQFLEDGQNESALTGWSSVFQSLFGSVDFRYLN